MVVLADVAAAAGVSIATASRALRGLPGVSRDTRVRVVEAARRLDYVLAPMTLSAPRGRIAVVVPTLEDWTLAAAVSVVARRLEEIGCVAELRVVDAPQRASLWHADFVKRRFHGVVVVGSVLAAEELDDVRRLGMPMVGLRSNLPDASIGPDDEALARVATNHLLTLGHRRIALVLKGDPWRVADLGAGRRLAGYRTALDLAGVETDDRLVVVGPRPRSAGGDGMSILLAGRELPSAVVADSDECALGVISTARNAGLAVPDDLSVVAVEGSWLASQLNLTAVTVDTAGQARAAADLVVQAVVTGGACVVPVTGDCAPELVVRGSSAPPRSRVGHDSNARIDRESVISLSSRRRNTDEVP